MTTSARRHRHDYWTDYRTTYCQDRERRQGKLSVITARMMSTIAGGCRRQKLTDEPGCSDGQHGISAVQQSDRPEGKAVGAYNFNFSLSIMRVACALISNPTPGGNFGVYDLAAIRIARRFAITIPKYWGERWLPHTLTGAIKQGGFAGVRTDASRHHLYEKSTDKGFNAHRCFRHLNRTLEVTINLAKANSSPGKLIFKGSISSSASTVRS